MPIAKTCVNCGAVFKVPPSQSARRKYCSRDCVNISSAYILQASERMRGNNNPGWRGGLVSSAGGYLATRFPEHPFSSNGYVMQHRVVMEQWLIEEDPNSIFLIAIGKTKYLAPGFDVHHMDKDRSNNSRSNLLVCTKQTHVLLHAGYGVNEGTFWPLRNDIIIDNSPYSELQRLRRKTKRQASEQLARDKLTILRG